MARTSSLGYAHADSSSQEEVLDRLRNNKLDKLTITARRLFPTTLHEFLEAVTANTSVQILKFVSSSADLEAQLESREALDSYLTALSSRLINLKTIVFHGHWKDIHVTTLLQALKASTHETTTHTYNLIPWCTGASLQISSAPALTELTQAIKRLRFQSIHFYRICLEIGNNVNDLSYLVAAMAMRSESICVPMVTTTTVDKVPNNKNVQKKVAVGIVPAQLLDIILYEDDSSAIPVYSLHNVRVGNYSFGGRHGEISQLNNLQPFGGDRKSRLQKLELVLSQEVTDFMPLISFCRRSPELTEVKVSIVMENTHKIVDLSAMYPSTAETIDFEISKKYRHISDGKGDETV